MSKTMNKATAIALVAACVTACPAIAQQAGDSDLIEIVVTAQRRVEKVTDVPISITVADQAQLERQQIETLDDLNRLAPSLEIQSAPGQNTGGGGAIRGIGTQTFSAGATASVGIVVDQVSQGNANISDLFDVARIEVLKGPQGTLFGLTTSAGVINITTNAPDPTGFSAFVRSELSKEGAVGSKFGDQIVQAAVNIPLSSDAAVRVATIANLRQGVDFNRDTGSYDGDDRFGVRARLLWKPSDAFSANVIADYVHERTSGDGDFFTFVLAGGPGILPLPTPFPITDPGIANELLSCGVRAQEGNQDFCTKQRIVNRSSTYGISVDLNYDLGVADLTSITAYRASPLFTNGANIFRADPLQLLITDGAVDNHITLFSQELRVSSPSGAKLDYTAGLFYSDQKTNIAAAAFDINLAPFPGLVIPIDTSAGTKNVIKDEQYAVFGQLTFHATDALRLIAGGRYTDARLSLYTDDLDTLISSSPSFTAKKVSYRFGAQYDLAPNTMVYATASRGFKQGQIATPGFGQAPYYLQPEIPSSYEVGLKTTLFAGWVLDLNAFYEKVKGFQAQQCLSNMTTGALTCADRNIDGVKTRGAEVNLFGKISPHLSLSTGFLLAKASYPDSFLGTDGTNIGGKQLAYAPEEKFTESGEYEVPIGSDLNSFFAVDTVWKSRLRYEANSVQDSTFRPHALVGSRIGIRSASDRYSVALFARNLFNVHEPELLQSGFPYNGSQNVGAIYGPLSFRQVGISFQGRF